MILNRSSLYDRYIIVTISIIIDYHIRSSLYDREMEIYH